MQEAWFDKITTRDNFDTLSKTVVWYKNGQEVKRMDILPSMKAPYCPACLMWRAKTVPMTDSKTFRGVWDDSGHPGQVLHDTFTDLQCPDCKGLLEGEGCTCGEVPHRVRCPMGFKLYFQDQEFDCRKGGL